MKTVVARKMIRKVAQACISGQRLVAKTCDSSGVSRAS